MTTNDSIFENGEFELSILDFINKYHYLYFDTILSYIVSKYEDEYPDISSIIAKNLGLYSRNRKQVENFSYNGTESIIEIEKLSDLKSGISTCYMMMACRNLIHPDSVISIDDTDNKEVCILFYDDNKDNESFISYLINAYPDKLGLYGENIECRTHHISDLNIVVELCDNGVYLMGSRLDLLDEDYITIKEDVTNTIQLFEQQIVQDKEDVNVYYTDSKSIVIQQFLDVESKSTPIFFGYKAKYHRK